MTQKDNFFNKVDRKLLTDPSATEAFVIKKNILALAKKSDLTDVILVFLRPWCVHTSLVGSV